MNKELYGCDGCVSALGLQHFDTDSSLFQQALDGAEIAARAVFGTRVADQEYLDATALYIRRAFVQKAYDIRNKEVEAIPIVATDERRFDEEKAQVRQKLEYYTVHREDSTVFDPARWTMENLEGMLPQTREYVLTLANILLNAQDDALRKAFPKRS